ncbi:MAG TPA: DUF2255 family protein [Cellulomonas sp.]
MAATWSPDELAAIDAAVELEIAVSTPDGGLGRWTPVWVVQAAGQVYLRTWHRRDTGWYGGAVSARRARIRVPGLVAEVVVEDIGSAAADLVAAVDAAYREKYGVRGAGSMVTATAAATTLRLTPGR